MNTSTTSVSIDLFYQILRIRRIEEAIATRYPEQKMRCPVHLSIGQEAIAVGLCHHLRPTDTLIGNHRAHAHYLAKGGDLKRMIAEIYGKETGCSKGRGGSMHLIDLSVGIIGTTPIVGGSIPVGVGVAFAAKLKKEESLTIIFFGEGATEEGVWAECLNFAALQKLPILFVCENNFYSVYSPLDVRQPKERNRAAIARAHGIPAKEGHGNDVEEVYRLGQEAVNSIRAHNGPYFLEFDTYRYREHCGPFVDDDAGYRPQEEIRTWHAKCPLNLYEAILTKRGLLTPSLKQEMEEELQAEIKEAFDFAEQSPFPTFNLSPESCYAND